MPRRDPFEPAQATPKKKSEPFPFVLDELSQADPQTRPMFGCLAVYVGERIVLILRDKGPGDSDSGVWVSFERENESAVQSLLPRLLPIDIFADKVAGWKKLSSRSPDFEDDVMQVCALILKGDPRIGKVPGKKKAKAASAGKQPAAKTKKKTGKKPAEKPAEKPAKKAAKKPAKKKG